MEKTNVCLVTRACLRSLLDWPACVISCDEEFIEGMKNDVIAAIIRDLQDRVPPHTRLRARSRIIEMGLGQKPNPSN